MPFPLHLLIFLCQSCANWHAGACSRHHRERRRRARWIPATSTGMTRYDPSEHNTTRLGRTQSWGGDLLYLFEDFALDTERRELRRADAAIAVQPKIFDLL